MFPALNVSGLFFKFLNSALTCCVTVCFLSCVVASCSSPAFVAGISCLKNDFLKIHNLIEIYFYSYCSHFFWIFPLKCFPCALLLFLLVNLLSPSPPSSSHPWFFFCFSNSSPRRFSVSGVESLQS